MRATLIANGVYEVVAGIKTKPDNTTTAEDAKWITENAKAMLTSWLDDANPARALHHL